MQSSADLFERSKAIVPGGVHSPVRAFLGLGAAPIFMQRADKASLYSVEGIEYTDFCMAFGALLLGHRHPEIERVLSEGLSRGWCYGTTEPYSLSLAEKITQLIPWVEKIRFTTSGTEAVTTAVRIARGKTGRDKIIKFEGCYHGHVDSLLVKAGSSLADLALADSLGVPQSLVAQTIVLPLGDHERLIECMHQHGEDIACVIIEPLPANYGLLPQDVSFFKVLREQTHHYGSALIFDEVITGFRVGLQGMAGQLQIEPDLVTYGKILGGGLPVAAVGGKKEWMDLVAPLGKVYHAGTLGANPLCMAAGLCTLNFLEQEPPYARLQSLLANAATKLNTFADQKGYPFYMQTVESLFWCVLGDLEDTTTVIHTLSQVSQEHTKLFKPFFFHLLEQHHLYLPPSAYEVGFLSLAHTQAHLDHLVDAIKITLDALYGRGHC